MNSRRFMLRPQPGGYHIVAGNVALCIAAKCSADRLLRVKTGGYRTATLMTGSPSINGHTGRFLTALPTDGAFSRYAAATLAPSKGRPAASSSRAT
jgi:hypothetical protein